MTRTDKKARGQLVAAALAGAWRAEPQELSIEQMAEVSKPLLESGCGALGWRRVRYASRTGYVPSPALFELLQAYRLHTLQAVLHEQQIESVFSLLNDEGIEAFVVKGWAVARLYPETGLRPFGDIDLCVHVDQYDAARRALLRLEEELLPVDLHAGTSKLDVRPWEELHARSRSVKLGDTLVRFPAPEDHLRILSQHLLKHGAWRPLWLCDVGAALEAAGNNFDWALCFACKRSAERVITAVQLAHQLLGADIKDTPAALQSARLPRWLVTRVLEQWSEPRVPSHYHIEMATYLQRPATILEGLRRRWPNAIEATVALDGPLNNWPRFPFQLGSFLERGFNFLSQQIKEQRKSQKQVAGDG